MKKDSIKSHTDGRVGNGDIMRVNVGNRRSTQLLKGPESERTYSIYRPQKEDCGCSSNILSHINPPPPPGNYDNYPAFNDEQKYPSKNYAQ